MKDVFKIFIGAILGFLIARIQSRLDQRRDAKSEFRICISTQRGRIPKESFLDFYTSTRNETRDAVSRLIPFLFKCEAARIEAVWTRYSNIEEAELSDQALHT